MKNGELKPVVEPTKVTQHTSYYAVGKYIFNTHTFIVSQ